MDEPDFTVDEVREAAFKLYAQWLALWDNAGGGGWTSAGEVYGDLVKYSPTNFDEIRQGHDHTLYVLHPSIGDEAGSWTLYVVAGKYSGYGAMGTGKDYTERMAKAPITIMSMWQVFDTRPQAVYEVEDKMNKKLGRTEPVGRFLTTPTVST